MSRKRFPATARIDAAVALFAALSHPVRLRILVALSREGPLSAGDLQDFADAEQSLVSHQLSTLKRNRLVSVDRDGRRMIYSLLDEHVAHIVEDAIKHVSEKR